MGYRRVFFSGVDGAGKTTAVASAVAALVECGLRPEAVWMRSLHTLSYLIYSGIERIVLGEKINRNKMRLFPEWSERAGVIWELVELTSIIPIILKLYLKKGKITIVDRGPVDFIASVYVRTGGKLVMSDNIISFFTSLYKNSILFYLRVPPESYHVILQRKANQLEYDINKLKKLIHAYDRVVLEFERRGVKTYIIRSDLMGLDSFKRLIRNTINRLICYNN